MNEIWTIGHSTRTIEQFVESLSSFHIEVLVDIRRFPHSRRNPHFNTDPLRRSLFQAGIRYEYLGDALGGFRKRVAGSPHKGLMNSSFQGYADHMDTLVFGKAVAALLAEAKERRTAYMCSERPPASCHRRLLSDHLALERGRRVGHILDPGESFEHRLAPTARLVDGHLIYAAPALEEFESPAGSKTGDSNPASP